MPAARSRTVIAVDDVAYASSLPSGENIGAKPVGPVVVSTVSWVPSASITWTAEVDRPNEYARCAPSGDHTPCTAVPVVPSGATAPVAVCTSSWSAEFPSSVTNTAEPVGATRIA